MKISHDIVNEWLTWLKQDHIPETIATKLFDDYKIYRLLEHDDEEGLTFTVQYFTTSLERYHRYISSFAITLRNKAFAKWGNQSTGFRSVMEEVQ